MPEVEFPVPTFGERGDLADRELPIGSLRLCQNMLRSERGRLSIRPGYIVLSATNPTDRIMGIAGFTTAAAANRQVAGTLTKVWQYDGTNWADITGAALTGTATDHVRFAIMSVSGTYKIVIMNGKDANKIWDGAAATCSAQGGSPGIFIDGMIVANRMLGLVAPETVWVSDFNNPESWPSGGGFRVRLVDAGDLMVGMGRLTRTSGAIIGEESQWVARAQSGSSPFRFDRVSESSGPLSAACIVRSGESILHWLAKDYNVYRFDGVQCPAIGWAMKSYVKDTIDPANEKTAHGVFVDELNKIFWLFPDTASGAAGSNRGIYLDVKTGEMGRLYFANPITAMGRVRVVYGVTWDSLASYTWDNIAVTYPTWDSLGSLSARRKVALGDGLGKIYVLGDGDGSDNGTSIDWAMEVPLKDYAGWANNFVPSAFETFFKQATNSTTVQTAIGHTDTLMASPSYTAFSSIDLVTDQRNDLDISALGEKRFVSVRHSGTAAKGGVEWLGGFFRAERVSVESGPTG